jgi:flagellar biosynthesis component FlhA
VLVEVNPGHAESLGLEVAEAAAHPVNGAAVFWTIESPAVKKIAEAANVRTLDVLEYVLLKAAVHVTRRPEEVLTITDVHATVKEIEKKYPGLMAEAFSSEFVNVSRLTEILQELVREGLSVRDFRQVVESIASYCSTYGFSMVQEKDFDVQDIVSYIRIDRRRQMLSRLLSERGTLKILTLSEELEGVLEDAAMDANNCSLALAPENFERMKAGLGAALEPLRARGLLPVSILCRPELRHKISSFVRACNRLVGVVTFEELDPVLPIEPSGTWSI